MKAKVIFRNIIAKTLFNTGVLSPAHWCHGRFVIVTFHRVLPEIERQNYPLPSLAVTPEELNILLSYFTKYFDCGTLALQHERYLSGETTKRPLLAITFDDAQYDNYINARPLLNRYQVKATFFAPVMAIEQQELLWHDRLGFSIDALLQQGQNGQMQLKQILDKANILYGSSHNLTKNVMQAVKKITVKERMQLIENLVSAIGTTYSPDFARPMTFDELEQLAIDGHEIGSHSMTHCMMPDCDDFSLGYEIEESRRKLQSHIAQPIESFCYPNGNSDTRTANAVAKAGYRRAVTTSWGYNEMQTNYFFLRRFDMNAIQMQDLNNKLSTALLAFRMSGLYPSWRIHG